MFERKLRKCRSLNGHHLFSSSRHLMVSHQVSGFPRLHVFLAVGLTAPRTHLSTPWASVGAAVMQAGDQGSGGQTQFMVKPAIQRFTLKKYMNIIHGSILSCKKKDTYLLSIF